MKRYWRGEWRDEEEVRAICREESWNKLMRAAKKRKKRKVVTPRVSGDRMVPDADGLFFVWDDRK